MRMYFKQRLFSWFDSYDIYNEQGNPIYVVKGQISWGHCLKIFDPYGNEAGTVKEQIFTFLPKFEIYQGNQYLGCIKKEFSFLKPRYDIDYNGWHIDGSFMEWDYKITDQMKTAVTVWLWVTDIVFCFDQSNVILTDELLCNGVDVIDKGTDDTKPCNIIQIIYDIFYGYLTSS